MTNNGKKIACVALASALCLGVGFSAVLGPISASADSYASYGNSYISGLGVQPTLSAVLYEVGGAITDPASFYQYRTNLGGYADSNENYYYAEATGAFEVEASIAYANTTKTLDFDFYEELYQDYWIDSVSFSSCMPSSPRFLHSWQWDCWRSIQPRITVLVGDDTYFPSLDEVSGEFVVYTYARGENSDSNTPYLRSYTYPCTGRILAGKAIFINPLPTLTEFVTLHTEVLTVPHEDGGTAGIMASIAFHFNHDIEGVNRVLINDTAFNNAIMAYNNYQEYEVAYMERFAEVNNVTLYDIDPLSSMWNVVDGFFNTELFDGFKFGDLLAIAVGSLLLGLFLKIFLGG